jgi:hypothetical protein
MQRVSKQNNALHSTKKNEINLGVRIVTIVSMVRPL